MTTTVIIKTSAHPVRVFTFPQKDGQPDPKGQYLFQQVVKPHCEVTTCCHSGADILVQEMAEDWEPQPAQGQNE